ncbi:2-amino-4-hydroxy-6-hydroxymethyldihydropteridine diphosphokinase [Pseudomonadota bacterium]
MILIGIGANLPSERFGAPVETCRAALDAIAALDGVNVVASSRWFESAPVPISDQPWYVNGAVRIETDLPALKLLAALHTIEDDFGRVRAERNAPRVLDLDLLAYNAEVIADGAHVPHPRLSGRAFVVLPILDIAPDWVHPQTGISIKDLAEKLPADQECRARPE